MKGSPNKNKPKKVIPVVTEEVVEEITETPEPIPYFFEETAEIEAPTCTHDLTKAIMWALVWVGVIILFFV